MCARSNLASVRRSMIRCWATAAAMVIAASALPPTTRPIERPQFS
jgi:hypothetical protein